MRITVRLFAILKDRANVDAFSLELAEGARVADALACVASEYPLIARDLLRCASAVNREYVKGEHVLKDEDELALIPPVSGG